MSGVRSFVRMVRQWDVASLSRSGRISRLVYAEALSQESGGRARFKGKIACGATTRVGTG